MTAAASNYYTHIAVKGCLFVLFSETTMASQDDVYFVDFKTMWSVSHYLCVKLVLLFSFAFPFYKLVFGCETSIV